MTNQPRLNFDSVTAPDFATEPLSYYVWHLEHHPQMYRQFRELADRYAARRPGRRISADMICHVLRFETAMSADGDVFAVNNNITPLYARLYAKERPAAKMDLRKSFLDTLLPDEQLRLDRAFARVRERQGGAA